MYFFQFRRIYNGLLKCKDDKSHIRFHERVNQTRTCKIPKKLREYENPLNSESNYFKIASKSEIPKLMQ